jgi:gamma-glutamyltranspeptidase / glutathione hydrolase
MHGVIAAGSQPTAGAGAEVLRRGGNAADAVAAACFATAAGEPALTSLAGGGIGMFRSAATGEVVLCDFFADAPRRRQSAVENLDFYGVDLDFGPTTQRFHIGAGAAAVPGVIPGLCTLVERWGRMDLEDVVAPACEPRCASASSVSARSGRRKVSPSTSMRPSFWNIRRPPSVRVRMGASRRDAKPW